MTLQQAVYFKEIAKTLNFTKAAHNLHMTQPSLSHSISALEYELSVPLFVRDGNKRIRLTSFGKEILPNIDNILDNITEIQEKINRMRNPHSGVVNISYSYINGFALVTRAFNKFYEEHSFDEITLNFTINHSAVSVEPGVVNGTLDFCITCTPEYAGLAGVEIMEQQLYVMLPIFHPLAGKDKLTLDDIKDEPLLNYHINSNLDRHILKMFQNHGLKPIIEANMDDWNAQAVHVSMGRGIAILPSLPYDPKLLTMAHLEDPMNKRKVYLQWPTNREPTPAAEYVKQYFIDFFKSNSND